MTQWNSNDVDRFWGLTEDLSDAVTQWKDSPDAGSAFYAALCVGHCQLYRVHQSLLAVDGFAATDVFVELFYVAWREVRRITELAVHESDSDEGLLQLSDGGVEARTLSLDILQSRLLFEGLQLFFDKLHRSPSISADTGIAESFRQRWAVYRQVLERLDETIDVNPEQMSLAAKSTWPHNVRMTLPADVWQPRPWWLTEYAHTILDDHQELVRHLSDPQLGGIVVAAPQDSNISLVRPSTANVEPQQAVEFSLAADSSRSPSLFELVEFRGVGFGVSLSSILKVSADYRGLDLYQLPATVPCRNRVSIEAKSDTELAADPQQVWRLRWGPLIRDVELNRIASAPNSEWQGDFEFAAGELNRIMRNNSWPQQHWRRLS